mmetsp:Transcript_25241/g.40410  ORF Transcript_25241/g.40410 Transcript_25241/m.40410 type:complete len:124 (+) Transcript_25241:1216-1587(+)
MTSEIQPIFITRWPSLMFAQVQVCAQARLTALTSAACLHLPSVPAMEAWWFLCRACHLPPVGCDFRAGVWILELASFRQWLYESPPEMSNHLRRLHGWRREGLYRQCEENEHPGLPAESEIYT